MASAPWRKNPLMYEINAWTWLAALTQKYGQPVTLGSVPDAEFDGLGGWGFDGVWLLGVWQTGPAGRDSRLPFQTTAAMTSSSPTASRIA